MRIEELYPWPEERLREILLSYPGVESVYWAQEEPANMGGWTFVRERLQQLLPAGVKLTYAGRAEAASPATGSLRVHKEEQAALCEAAFEGL